MPSNRLGEVSVEIKADTKGLKKGLDKAEGQVKKSSNRMRGFLSNIGGRAKGAAGRIPGAAGAAGLAGGIGGLAGAAGPIGLGVGVGVGAVTGIIGGLIKNFKDLNDELKPMVARSGIAAERLDTLRKVAERLGSEDGLEGVTDSAQELGLRLQDLTGDGFRADESLTELGLSGDELRQKSPEEALLAVIKALQGVEDQQRKNFLADDLLGGSWEKISGILKISNDEFIDLTEELGSNEEATRKALEQTEKLDQAQQKLNLAFDKVKTAVAGPVIGFLVDAFEAGEKLHGMLKDLWSEISVHVTPVFTVLKDLFVDDLLPALGDLAQAVWPTIKPFLEHLKNFLGSALKNVLNIIKGIILIIAGVLTLDFAKAWEGIQMVVQGVVNQVVNIVEFLGNSIAEIINGLVSKALEILDKMGEVPLVGGAASALADKLRGARIEEFKLPRLDLSPSGVAAPTPSHRVLAALGGGTGDLVGAAGSAAGAGVHVVNNFYGDNYGDDDFAEKVRSAQHQNGRIGASGS